MGTPPPIPVPAWPAISPSAPSASSTTSAKPATPASHYRPTSPSASPAISPTALVARPELRLATHARKGSRSTLPVPPVATPVRFPTVRNATLLPNAWSAPQDFSSIVLTHAPVATCSTAPSARPSESATPVLRVSGSSTEFASSARSTTVRLATATLAPAPPVSRTTPSRTGYVFTAVFLTV